MNQITWSLATVFMTVIVSSPNFFFLLKQINSFSRHVHIENEIGF